MNQDGNINSQHITFMFYIVTMILEIFLHHLDSAPSGIQHPTIVSF